MRKPILGEDHKVVNRESQRKKVILERHINVQKGRKGTGMEENEGRRDQKRDNVATI